MKNLINFKDYTKEELEGILDMAYDMKQNPEKYSEVLKGKKLYTLFEKTSTRTFLSFTTGITELGGTYYNQKWEDSNFVLGDTVSEVKYLGHNVDIIMARLKRSETTDIFGTNSIVPFINGCDNTFHPCQAMADMLAIKEQYGTYEVKVLYIGAKNNTFNSLTEALCKLGGTMYGLTPLVNDMGVGDEFYNDLKATGHYIEVNPASSKEDIKKIAEDMDVIYTDTWVDMEFFNNPEYAQKKEETIAKMLPYQINSELLENSKAIVLHDMPMHIGYEISQEVVDSNLDYIINQAENRRHAEKAIMVHLLKEC
ncbi:MAG: ornithine carbamoyltransferase [Eubacterium sp.]